MIAVNVVNTFLKGIELFLGLKNDWLCGICLWDVEGCFTNIVYEKWKSVADFCSS